MGDWHAEAVLKYMIELFLYYAEELYDSYENNDFCYGQMLAYIESLEIMQNWEKAKDFLLDFDLEEVYPLSKKSKKKVLQ